MSNSPTTFYEQEIERYQNDVALRSKQIAQLRRSKQLMEQRHADNIELNELAAVAFMSRFHYVRMFQRIYGLTPRSYLRDLRITKAKQLLMSGVPVTQVCFDVGYQSLPTFSSVFKKCVGVTPTAYQRMHTQCAPQ